MDWRNYFELSEEVDIKMYNPPKKLIIYFCSNGAYILGRYKKHLSEMFLLGTQNIYFYRLLLKKDQK